MGAAKRLRCDQAAPEVAPRVVLELTLGQRRFRLERSPAWERPKQRGTGVTTQQASVTMSELRDGAWSPLSSRLDETGDLVGRLVGMNLTQFTQVALLPQGRFQTFLRAKSDERHQLLQQLFRTGRFAEVERWLRERRLSLGRTDVEAHQRVADVVSRISEATGCDLPDGWDVHDLRDVTDRRELLPWATDLRERAEADLVRCRDEAGRSAVREMKAREALAAAREALTRRARYDAARRERELLQEGAARHRDDSGRLDAAHRAATVLPLHRHAVAGERAAATAAQRFDEAIGALHSHLGPHLDPHLDHLVGGVPSTAADLTDLTALTELADQATTAAADARSALPRLTRLRRAGSEADQVEAQRDRVAAQVDTARAELALLPARLAELRARVEVARSAAERVPVLTASAEALRRRLDAHAEVLRLHTALSSARQEWLVARELVARPQGAADRAPAGPHRGHGGRARRRARQRVQLSGVRLGRPPRQGTRRHRCARRRGREGGAGAGRRRQRGRARPRRPGPRAAREPGRRHRASRRR